MAWEWFYDPREYCEDRDLGNGITATLTTEFVTIDRFLEKFPDGFDPETDKTTWELYTWDTNGKWLTGRFSKPTHFGPMTISQARAKADKLLKDDFTYPEGC